MATTRETLLIGQRVIITDCIDYTYRNGMTGVVFDIAPQDTTSSVRQTWPVNVHLDERRGNSYFDFFELTLDDEFIVVH